MWEYQTKCNAIKIYLLKTTEAHLINFQTQQT